MIQRIELSDDAEYTISNGGKRIEITRGSAVLQMSGGGGGGIHAGTATPRFTAKAVFAATHPHAANPRGLYYEGSILAECNGYTLFRTPSGYYTAGCRGPWTAGEALRHWGPRTDTRALVFSEAIKRAEGL